MVWGTFLEKNFPSSNWHLLDFGGSKPLPGLFGPLFSDMKCPRVPFECGAGGAIAIWAMPKYLRGRELSVDNFG